jgi:hypothetical protein
MHFLGRAGNKVAMVELGVRPLEENPRDQRVGRGFADHAQFAVFPGDQPGLSAPFEKRVVIGFQFFDFQQVEIGTGPELEELGTQGFMEKRGEPALWALGEDQLGAAVLPDEGGNRLGEHAGGGRPLDEWQSKLRAEGLEKLAGKQFVEIFITDFR